MKLSRLYLFLFPLLIVAYPPSQADAQTDRTDVVAFWGFTQDFDFAFDSPPIDPDAPEGPNFQDFLADVDNTVGSANLQAYIGAADELDNNGGGGFVPYISPVSGESFEVTRTIRWTDIRGPGDDFSIGGVNSFLVDRNDGLGAVPDDFGNDALIYITIDGTGFQDFQLRFDVEGTPGLDPLDPTASDLPTTFDVFYRTTGPGGTWFRAADQNNIDLIFSDLDPLNPDPENQVADSGFITLSAALDNEPQIEIIISDFANEGNNEMELDNIEIVANLVPGTGLLGDVDQNNVVNFFDIGPFITLLTVSGFQFEADINGDGTVDFFDIGPFIGILSS